jgi:hypothetical protein
MSEHPKTRLHLVSPSAAIAADAPPATAAHDPRDGKLLELAVTMESAGAAWAAASQRAEKLWELYETDDAENASARALRPRDWQARLAAADAHRDALFDRLVSIASAAADLPAVTVAGLSVKARAAVWCRCGEPGPGEDANPDDRLAWSIIGDLNRLGSA